MFILLVYKCHDHLPSPRFFAIVNSIIFFVIIEIPIKQYPHSGIVSGIYWVETDSHESLLEKAGGGNHLPIYSSILYQPLSNPSFMPSPFPIPSSLPLLYRSPPCLLFPHPHLQLPHQPLYERFYAIHNPDARLLNFIPSEDEDEGENNSHPLTLSDRIRHRWRRPPGVRTPPSHLSPSRRHCRRRCLPLTPHKWL